MSKRLMEKIERYLVTEESGVTKLALAVNKHQGTVQRWITARRIPGARDRYNIALACGCTDEEAFEFSKESLSEAMKAG